MDNESEGDPTWQDAPYVVVPPFTAIPRGHLAIEVHGFLPTRKWGDTSMVYVRTKCGIQNLHADRSNYAFAPCKRCFPLD